MAWHFNEVDQFVTVDDNAALTFPAADWTLAAWLKLDDNSGSVDQWWFSKADFIKPCINLWFYEASNPTQPNQHKSSVTDNTYWVQIISTGSPGSNTSWQHFMLQRSGNNLTQYFDGVADGTTSQTPWGALDDAGTLKIGRRDNGDTTRYYGGAMAELAKWDRALTSGEINALSKGFAPSFFCKDRKFYIDMIRPFRELDVPLDVASYNGVTVVDHPRIIYPSSSRQVMGSVGQGVTVNLPTLSLTGNPQDAIIGTSIGANCWGDSGASEDVRSWADWSDGSGGSVSVSGNADYGKLLLTTGQIAHSPVVYTETGNQYFTITQDKYGSGSGSFSTYIRGDTSIFGQDDVLPAWEAYTGEVLNDWEWVQVKLVGA